MRLSENGGKPNYENYHQVKYNTESDQSSQQTRADYRYRDSLGELKMFSVNSDDILILIYVFGRIRMLEANIGV